ncbi:hypothetical protein [Autumnicola musiva]|uniref:Lipoprotein n=1 Tax=Autumnicola musiva TaxID=3075589 RepID=A0ABU3D6Z5_9FLAO|nr:hypothetical protein [Zunongwangia sp. F117]MDT0677307.1 hypothetical protein [Zunongwangia sp. F117]
MKVSNMIKIFLLLSISLFVTNCETNTSSPTEQESTCSDGMKEVKRVSEIEGFVAFNTDMNKYMIYSGIDGDYDSQDVGILCNNIPDEFIQDEIEIIFSGTYYTYPNEIEKRIPGQNYFLLEINSIKKK